MSVDKSKQVSTWHIDQVYLESIWSRVDTYNKYLEQCTNLKYEAQVLVYKQCYTLLKNIYNDFCAYIKDFADEYTTLKSIKSFLWATPPKDQEKRTAWIKKLKESEDFLDERKRLIIVKLAQKQSLLTHKIEWSEMDKIKRVMRDE